ncbi:Appr-1-p processing protein [Bifidobacterium thermophilum]|uniref:Appr-1-p processing protein n=1 Tax=Bifidobacterium thermophilum TaxID=33905 RepID=A0A2N3QG07_9BIFI|nr:protein-ADP-ribose hydrolase [Bifidobacterium thermophilum]PKU89667.1 Appr-1-p processing protein [Bifidobacterium thermophilum]
MNQLAQRLTPLVRYLADERAHTGGWTPGIRTDEAALSAMTAQDLWALFRAFVNTREPIEPDRGWLKDQDALLHDIIADWGITAIDDACVIPSATDPRLRLWRGDITAIRADAIVNAANSEMLGCWAPGHLCIDNAIHTFAGVELRLECARIMREQGTPEAPGRAKITPGYNLPAAHVIHTVGPIAAGHPSDRDRKLLTSSYRSCLDLAVTHGLHSIVFCCISTGVFGFPQQEAAEIAVRTVRAWLDRHADTSARADQSGEPADPDHDSTPTTPTVIFDVFGEADEHIYRQLLGIPGNQAT